MIYTYTEENRLLFPHKYMYTTFEGDAFLKAYVDDRLTILKQMNFEMDGPPSLLSISKGFCLKVSSYYIRNAPPADRKTLMFDRFAIDKPVEYSNDIYNSAETLKSFETTTDIETFGLLIAIITNQLLDQNQSLVKKWIDLIIQRFEVSKKIFESYLPGFRKGQGRSDDLRLYWLLLLCLNLHYIDTKRLNVLSTMLKVSDLICSQTIDIISPYNYNGSLMIAFSAELMAFSKIIKSKGIQLES